MQDVTDESTKSTTRKTKPKNVPKAGKQVSKVKRQGSVLEETLEFQLKCALMPRWEREFKFDATGRRWRFDFCWPDRRVAVELNGGSWVNGGHSRGTGFENDCYKHNAAVQQGWKVLVFTGKMVKSGEAIAEIERLLWSEGLCKEFNP